MAVGGQGDRVLERAVARELKALDGSAAAHVQGRAGGELDPLESGGGVEGVALGAVAVLLQAHVEVVVPQLGSGVVVLLRDGVVLALLLGARAVVVVILGILDVLGIVIGVIIKIVEIEVLVVLGDLIDVISALGALPRECGRRHGVPFAWAD